MKDDYYYQNQLKLQLTSLSLNYSNEFLKVLYVRSSRYCHKETTYGNITLHWPTANVGQVVLTEDLCVGRDGIPAKRKCSGDLVEGAFWSAQVESLQVNHRDSC